MKAITRECGHKQEIDEDVIGIFGEAGFTGLCPDCQSIRQLYEDVYLAMAGNIYSTQRLAIAGYIPGSNVTLGDLNRAGNVLFAQLDSNYKQIDEERVNTI